MAILFYSRFDDPKVWREAILEVLPGADFRVHPDSVGDPADIEYAIIWKPEPGALARFPNLKAMFALGAGVDAMVGDRSLPKRVPLVRLVDPAMTRGMSEYVIHWVLRYHRDFHVYAEQARERVWKRFPARPTPERSVGVMGLGELGADAAAKLAALGFDVAGWSRTRKRLKGVACFAGRRELAPFLARSQILVCLLPLTPATEGILDARALARLPKGAFVISAARGGHVVERDLIEALESGHVARAALDAFRTEPLPSDHPFWRHPRIDVTPHCSGPTFPRSASREIAKNIRRMMRGLPPKDIVDRRRGY
jgi:glyoxylate/hydroxypyruvate reductase A